MCMFPVTVKSVVCCANKLMTEGAASACRWFWIVSNWLILRENNFHGWKYGIKSTRRMFDIHNTHIFINMHA